MRFSKNTGGPCTGYIDITTFFAWIPISIGCEVRWLEEVRVKRRYFKLGMWEYQEFLN